MRLKLIRLSVGNYFMILVLIGLLSGFSSCSGNAEAKQNKYWPEITKETKPWTRWWWLGSAVDDQNLADLLHNYAEKGIGGVEITPIYGVKGEEDNYIDFLSDEWIARLNTTISEAHKNGMGVDMNTGTGWPFGGPHIGDEYAAKRLNFTTLEHPTIEDVVALEKKLASKEDVKLLAFRAINKKGEQVDLLSDREGLKRINKVGLKAVAAWQSNTNQKVKRAAPGGEGLVFNHFSKEATEHYLKRFSDAFAGKKPQIRCFFNDSYELSRASSTEELFEIFKEKKGYDLADHLAELSSDEKTDKVARIKSDYREVIGGMLLENFTNTWTNWANSHGAMTKNQAHGSPANLIDLYSVVGIPEIEIFHATDFPFLQDYIDQSDSRKTEHNALFKKFAASAAHMQGKKLVSCETFTWLNEHFKTPLFQCKPELDDLFIKGVNHVFFHGTAYSPKRAEWPGWLFYASTHMEPNNPQWAHIQEMNSYITRCQSVLQKGQANNDFIVYWPLWDYRHDGKGKEQKLTLHNSERWIHMPAMDILLDKGYQFDFTTDRIIGKSEVKNGEIFTSEEVSYKTIVIPHCERMPLATIQKLVEMAKNGAKIIFESLPSHVSGYADYQMKEKKLQELYNKIGLKEGVSFVKLGEGEIYVGNDLEAYLADVKVYREKLNDYHVKSISRKSDDGVYYFIANHQKNKIEAWLPFLHGGNDAVFMDPMTGKVTKAEVSMNGNESNVLVQLSAGASLIVWFPTSPVSDIKPHEYPQEGKSTSIEGSWTFTALNGGPILPGKQELDNLKYWSAMNGDAYENFSGVGVYETTFDFQPEKGKAYRMDFDGVGSSVRVIINGKEAGTLWAYPFSVQVDELLKNGTNSIRLEVASVGANRLRDLDRRGVNWKKFHNINIVNLRYKKMDATQWETVPSGLAGNIRIVELNTK
ncbi:glycoside hydrolase [Puteibacter caeruleilacunae]|nr:glycoside hydrolase [Puteibacter caeruleilacunae]